MKIEAGKYYKTRDGRKVGPVVPLDGNDRNLWVDGAGGLWNADGSAFFGPKAITVSIIAEWTDAPAIDLTAITTPWGLLDEATREALKAHGGPWEMYDGGAIGWQAVTAPSWVDACTYRVKPAPPKPREFWLGCGGGYRHVYDNANSAQVYKDCNIGTEVIHVREVLP